MRVCGVHGLGLPQFNGWFSCVWSLRVVTFASLLDHPRDWVSRFYFYFAGCDHGVLVLAGFWGLEAGRFSLAIGSMPGFFSAS